jgi:O-antigen/teichoic acid export membrane protein
LLIGQLAAALTTTTPELLGMTGYAKSLLKVNALAAVTLCTGLVVLIPSLGAEGAAMATAATMVVNALGVTFTSYRKMGFVPLGALYAMLRGAKRAAYQ